MSNAGGRRTLLVDIGGVVLVDPLAGIFDELAASSTRDRGEITDFFGIALRKPFWTGRLSEPEFWQKLTAHAGADGDPSHWRNRLFELMRPLPAAVEIPRLAAGFRLSVLSNHRSEWLRPALAEYDLADQFERVFISSEIGIAKPDPRAFEHALSELGVPPEDAVAVDDKQGNLDTADRVGMQTRLADAEGQWIGTFLQAL